jgi:hypothetical protein
MDRMGHDNERAALIYLHGSDARQQAIADSLGKLARDELKRASNRQRIGHATGTKAPADILTMIKTWASEPLTCAEAKRPDRDSNAGPTA